MIETATYCVLLIFVVSDEGPVHSLLIPNISGSEVLDVLFVQLACCFTIARRSDDQVSFV